MAITVSAIISEWGALYRAGLATVSDLMVKLMEKSETEALFPLRVTESTIMEKATAEFSSVVQAFQKAFTPKSGVTFLPRKIPLQRLKIDVAEYPDDLSDSWLGFLTDNKLDRKQWPFVRWWLTNLIAKGKEDIEKFEIYLGEPAAVTPGTANDVGENMLGLRKQIRDGVDDGDINSIAQGAIPTGAVDMVDYIEEWFRQIPELLRNEIDVVCVSRSIRDLFQRGMRLKYDQNYNQTADKRLTIMDTNVEIKGLLSQTGSDLIWATPKWNRQMGIKGPANPTMFQLESEDRKVKAFTDWYQGVGFWIHEYVYCNDQDLEEA